MLTPADRVLRARLRESVRFPDLTERRALKVSAIPHYSARVHFEVWHRRMGGLDFTRRTGIFTPLFHVDFEATDVPLDLDVPLHVRGATWLAKTVDASGAINHIVRVGRHTLVTHSGDGDAVVVARAHLINVFTRDDPDPQRRRVVTLPPDLGLGDAPSRIIELPRVDTLAPVGRRPDCSEAETHVWHYGQTDPNRHVSAMEYLRAMESYVADMLQRAGHDLRRAYYSRARIIYRKPCFRGESYRRVAWFCGEAPLVVTGAFYKAGDAPDGRPAVAVELTLSQHEDAA
ncbi:MAG: hypothetical protein ACHQ4J_01765 [Candidatus Binatia bacterium]